MSNSSGMQAIFVYVLVLPIAIFLGYLLATPTEVSSAGTIAVVLVVLALPLVLKWHHQSVLLSWNMTAVVFFLPASPPFWLVLAFLSLAISVGQRALDKEHRFIVEPSVTWPIIFLAVVVMVTAKATGGFGMRVLGSGLGGGSRYVLIFGGIAGFFAMTANRIEHKAELAVALFFLGSLTDGIGTLIPYGPRELYPLALMFPVSGLEVASADSLSSISVNQGVTRFFGLTVGTLGFLAYLLSRGGVSGLMAKPWRLILFIGILVLGSMGGFRSFFILVMLTCFFVFIFEGLYRTKYLGYLLLLTVLVGAALVGFSDKLPLSVQRTLSFLPLKIDPIARYDAEVSSEWRLQMWSLVLPQVPQYFWLGKGMGVDLQQLNLMSELVSRSPTAAQEIAMMAGDYHSGPLTVLIQFGIWGLLGWLWLIGAGVRALWLNYRNGAENLKYINILLLSYFVAKIIFFFGVYGSFYTDVPQFCGLLGFSLSLNHGIRRAKRVVESATGERPLEEVGAAIPATA